MKKSNEGNVLFRERSITMGFKMKICLLITTFMLFQLSANTVMSQRKVEFNYENVPLKQILKEIKGQTGYHFFYNVNEINDNQTMSLKANSETTQEILKRLSEKANFDYKISGNQIVLTKKKISKSSPLEKEITGTINDDQGNPLPGASVVVKGTTIGTQTDFDGNFTLEVPDDATIISISFISSLPAHARVYPPLSLENSSVTCLTAVKTISRSDLNFSSA